MNRGPCFAAIALILPLAACGGESSRTYSDGEGNEIEITQNGDGGETSFEVKTGGGEDISINSGAAVDADLPEGYSVYPGARVVTATNFNQAGRKGSLVVMQSDDPVAKIAAYYRKQAEAAGVEIQSETKTQDSQMLIGGTEEKGGFTLLATSGEEGTTVNLTVADTGVGG